MDIDQKHIIENLRKKGLKHKEISEDLVQALESEAVIDVLASENKICLARASVPIFRARNLPE
jgi:hypothetical protein